MKVVVAEKGLKRPAVRIAIIEWYHFLDHMLRWISTVANLSCERTRPCRVLFFEIRFDDVLRRSRYHDFFQKFARADRAVGAVYDLLGLPICEKTSLVGCRGVTPAGGLPPSTMLERPD